MLGYKNREAYNRDYNAKIGVPYLKLTYKSIL